MVKQSYALPRAAKPEDVGVSSAAIASFVRLCEESGVENHSLMIIRHGKVAYEAWRAPYSANTPHTLYSVSKSIIAIAAGFAIDEGLLTPQTKLIDVFPEFCPQSPDEDLENITLHTLMTMTAGKNVSLIADKTSKYWVRDFINTKQSYKPGEGWSYINENSYCVAAMISKACGTSVTEYLRTRLYEPLGITSYQWECDPTGVETGGWGLFLKTEDLAKIALCYLNNGVFDGKQVIPEEWTKTSSQDLTKGINNAPGQGYGYFIWGCDCDDNSFRFDGMFSQFAIGYRNYDAVVVSTNNEINEEKAIGCINQFFPDAFFDGDSPAEEEIPAFRPLEETNASERHAEIEKRLSSKTIKLTQHPLPSSLGFPLSMLTIPAVYMSAHKGGPVDNVRFKFYDDECTMYWTEGDNRNIIHIGLDGNPRVSSVTLGKLKYTASSAAVWKSENVLEVHIRLLETICKRILRFTFKGNRVTVVPSSSPSLSFLCEKLEPTVQNSMAGQLPRSVIRMMMLNAYRLIDTTYRGKLQ